MANAIPPLERHCGSWIAVHRSTARPVIEIWQEATARAVNQSAYAVFTALQWLCALNRAIKAGEADYCRAALDSLLSEGAAA